MISLLIGLSLFGVFGSLIILNILYPYRKGEFLFDIFIMTITLERIWETFYTTREKEPRRLEGDWTWVMVILTYLITGLVIIFEFFVKSKRINLFLSFFAGFVFFLAFLLRLWGVKTLADQWTTHAVGKSKIREIRLITNGPYRFIRHPVYLGSMLEVLTLTLIPGCYFAFAVSLVLNLPAYFIRIYFEEKTSLERFGDKYLHYRRTVPMLFPFKFKM